MTYHAPAENPFAVQEPKEPRDHGNAIRMHDLVFVYGPSGSGKTAFLGLLAGILEPQQGGYEVLGREMTEMSLSARDELRGSEMRYIFRSFNLISYLSVGENIDLPCRIHGRRRARILVPTLNADVDRIAGRSISPDPLLRQ